MRAKATVIIMKRLLSLLLLSALCLTFVSCDKNNEEVSTLSGFTSSVSEIQYLDAQTSKFIKYFDEQEFDNRIYFECTITTGDIETQYIGAKNGDCMYIKYINSEQTDIFVCDGDKCYSLNQDEKTASVIGDIPVAYSSLISAFSKEQLDRFYETGSETLDSKEYTYEIFNTDGGFVKYYINSNGAPIYLYNWYTGTTDNSISKVAFSVMNNEPDAALFTLPEEYKVV